MLQDYVRDLRTMPLDSNDLVEANLRLVVSIAKRFTGRGVDLLDLMQEGNLGLMHAAELYRPELGFCFTTYAAWWIKQKCHYAICDMGSVIRIPRYMQEILKHVINARNELYQELQRTPTIAEVAFQTHLSRSEIEEALCFASLGESLSLDQARDNDGNRLAERVTDSALSVEDEVLATCDTRDRVNALLNHLTPRERQVVERRYGLQAHAYDQVKTLKQTAKELGISFKRVRQLQDNAINSFRKHSQEVA